MKASEYMSVLSRTGKRMEKELCNDFKENPKQLEEILSEFDNGMLRLQNVIINAFLSK